MPVIKIFEVTIRQNTYSDKELKGINVPRNKLNTN